MLGGAAGCAAGGASGGAGAATVPRSTAASAAAATGARLIAPPRLGWGSARGRWAGCGTGGRTRSTSAEHRAGGVDDVDEHRRLGDDVLALVPEERPVLLQLREVGLHDEDARHDAARDEREVGAVAAIRGDLAVRADARDHRHAR